MAYTSPETINGSSIVGLLNYVNEVTNSWISNLLLIAFYVILIFAYYKAREDFGGALAVAGFGTFIVAFLLFLANFVSGVTLAIWIALAVIGFSAIALDKPRGTA